MDLYGIIERAVDIDSLLKQVDLNPDNFEQCSLKQPGLLLEAAKLRVQCMIARQNAESLLESKKASKSIELRKAKERAEEKITEVHLATLVNRDATIKILKKKLNKAEAAEEFSKLLIEAYRHRRDSIKAIGDSRNTEMIAIRGMSFQQNSQESKLQTRRKMQQKYAGQS